MVLATVQVVAASRVLLQWLSLMRLVVLVVVSDRLRILRKIRIAIWQVWRVCEPNVASAIAMCGLVPMVRRSSRQHAAERASVA